MWCAHIATRRVDIKPSAMCALTVPNSCRFAYDFHALKQRSSCQRTRYRRETRSTEKGVRGRFVQSRVLTASRSGRTTTRNPSTRGPRWKATSTSRRCPAWRPTNRDNRIRLSSFDFVFDLLVDECGSVACVYFIIDEADVALAMKQPWVAVGSDGSSLAIDGPLRSGVPHPRSFGTFPRVLGHYVRELKVIPLEEAVRKMTSLPASILNLSDRGTIATSKWADLVIFDPATVADKATFEDPFQYPVGIDTVLVNGKVVLDEGKDTGARPGKVLKRPAK